MREIDFPEYPPWFPTRVSLFVRLWRFVTQNERFHEVMLTVAGIIVFLLFALFTVLMAIGDSMAQSGQIPK